MARKETQTVSPISNCQCKSAPPPLYIGGQWMSAPLTLVVSGEKPFTL